MKKLAVIALTLSMILVTACGNEASSEGTSSASSEASESVSESAKEENSENTEAEVKNPPAAMEITEKWEDGFLPQLEEQKKDSPYATIKTSKGDIKIVLYPEAAPLTVKNFIVHANEGYYNGLKFHRVIDGFMIQGGDPMGTGIGGESIYGVPFRDEPNDHLHNFRGALSMANAGPYTNGSQFFIMQGGPETVKIDDSNIDVYKSQIYFNKITTKFNTECIDYFTAENPTEDKFKEKVAELEKENNALLDAGPKEDPTVDAALEAYKKVGGAPHLDNKHTVFGQVVEGMDIVDAIAKSEKDENDMPKEDIIIESIVIENAPAYN